MQQSLQLIIHLTFLILGGTQNLIFLDYYYYNFHFLFYLFSHYYCNYKKIIIFILNFQNYFKKLNLFKSLYLILFH